MQRRFATVDPRFAPGAELPNDREVLLEKPDAVYAAVREGFNWLDPTASGELIDRIHGDMDGEIKPHASLERPTATVSRDPNE